MRNLVIAAVVLSIVAGSQTGSAQIQRSEPANPSHAVTKPGRPVVRTMNPSQLQQAQYEVKVLQTIQETFSSMDASTSTALARVILEKRCEIGVSVLGNALLEAKLDVKRVSELQERYRRACTRGNAATTEEPEEANIQSAQTSNTEPPPESSPIVCELTSEIEPSFGIHEQAPIAQPQPGSQTNQYPLTVITSILNTGNQVTGPRTIRAAYVNRLRFDAALGSTTTLGSAPTFPTQLVPSLAVLPAAPKTPKGVSRAGAGQSKLLPKDNIERIWQNYWTCYGRFDASIRNIEVGINDAIQSTNDTTSTYSAVLNRFSSKLLPEGEVEAMKAAVNDDNVFGAYKRFNWPTTLIGDLSQNLGKFTIRLQQFAQTNGFADWITVASNKQRYDLAQARVAEMQQHLGALGPGSDTANRLRASQDAAEMWRKRFNAVQSMTALDLKPAFDVDCDTWFGKSNTTVVRLVTRDMMAQNPAPETSDLVTVVCFSPLTVSTGVGFSLAGDKTPAFVPGRNSSGAVIQTLGYSSNSAAKPIYVFQINSRILSRKTGSVELHGTLGAAISTTESTGTLGFVLGPSFSFVRRTFFVTPALHLERRTVFLPGFKVGDPQGDLTSPPTQLRWRPSFATSITFPINP